MPLRALKSLACPSTRIGYYAGKIKDKFSYRTEILNLASMMHNAKKRDGFLRFEIPVPNETYFTVDGTNVNFEDHPDLLIYFAGQDVPEAIVLTYDPELLALDCSRAAFLQMSPWYKEIRVFTVWNLGEKNYETPTSPDVYAKWVEQLETLRAPRPHKDLCTKCSGKTYPCKYAQV